MPHSCVGKIASITEWITYSMDNTLYGLHVVIVEGLGAQMK